MILDANFRDNKKSLGEHMKKFCLFTSVLTLALVSQAQSSLACGFQVKNAGQLCDKNAPSALIATSVNIGQNPWHSIVIGLSMGTGWQREAVINVGENNSTYFPYGTSSHSSSSGKLVSANIGYGYQPTSNTLIRGELDLSFGKIFGNSYDVSDVSVNRVTYSNLNTRQLSSVTSQLGLLLDDSTMIFSKFGVAQSNYTAVARAVRVDTDTLTTLSKSSSNLFGYVVGIGIERFVSSKITSKLELNYLSFGPKTTDSRVIYGSGALPTGTILKRKREAEAVVFKLGINYYLY